MKDTAVVVLKFSPIHMKVVNEVEVNLYLSSGEKDAFLNEQR